LGCPICQEIDQQVQVFFNRSLESSGYAYVYLDATFLKGWLGHNTQAVYQPPGVA
jgi:putative transposase